MAVRGGFAEGAHDRVDWRQVALFVALSFAISAAAWIGLRTLSVPMLARTVLAMFGPYVAARALSYQGSRRPSSLTEWAAAARCCGKSFALVAGLLGAGTAVAALAGLQGLRPINGGLATELAITSPVLVGLYMFSAYGEEYGWRGYLHDLLAPLGPTKTALITAPIWGLWHSPAILLYGFNYPHHRLEGVGMMIVFAIPFSLILTWLRTSSGGILAPTAAHAAFDALAAMIAMTTWHQAMVLSAPVGLTGMVPFALLAIWLVARSRVGSVSAIPAPTRRAAFIQLAPAA
jgi:membrane protease YdiL (CAAX protease family)